MSIFPFHLRQISNHIDDDDDDDDDNDLMRSLIHDCLHQFDNDMTEICYFVILFHRKTNSIIIESKEQQMEMSLDLLIFRIDSRPHRKLERIDE